MESRLLSIEGKDFELFFDGDQESNKLALFLHGFPECAHGWRHQVPEVAALGYKCWVPNLRGYGGSYSPTEVSEYDTHVLVEDLVQMIKASNCTSVLVIAHDWGGALAWQLALRHPKLVDRMVVMNCPHPAKFASELQKWRQLKRSWYMFAFLLPWLPEWYLGRNSAGAIKGMIRKGSAIRSHFTNEDFNIYRSNALRPGGLTAMLNWYRSALRKKSQVGGLKAKIKVPTLMIWGEKDPALGIHTVLGTNKYVENLDVRYIPEAGHFVHEEAPKVVNEILLAWVKGEAVPGQMEPTSIG